MNRKDLQALSRLRLKEAKSLLKGEMFSGAYYLAGYSVEFALKACIARDTERFEFQDKRRTLESYTHDLKQLLKTARLQQSFEDAWKQDRALESHWDVVVLWSETSRYRIHTDTDAQRIIEAISQSGHGVLPWLMQRW